jgi:Flp pilus assembly protein TadD
MLTSTPKETSELFRQGSAKLDARDYGGAEEIFRRVLSATPNSADAHNSLAVALHELGRSVDATGHLRLAITLEPNHGMAHYNLGVVLESLGYVSEALDSYLRAVALIPRYPTLRNNLADALWKLDRLDEALKHARRAVALKPDDPAAHLTLGNILVDLMRVDDGTRSFRRAIALRPGYAMAHNNLGLALIKLGRFDEAIKAIEHSLALDPRTAAAYGNLTECKKLEPDDPHLEAMEKLVRETENVPRKDRSIVHFALGKAYSDLRMHERAFEHLLKGNALKRQEVKYDEGAEAEYLRSIETLFSAEFIRQRQGMGNASRMPVFILGMPRSGSTLVEQILARHPRVYGAGEIRDFGEVVREEAEAAQIHGRYPEIATEFGPQHFQAIGKKYLERLRKLSSKSERITNKMPSNFEYVGPMHLAFPNATIIHTVRDPVDTCLSCFSQYFQRGQGFSYDLAELGRYYLMYRGLMDHWNRVLPPGRMFDVQYEDVVEDLEGAARRIVAHCGLEWDDACLSFHRADRVVLTASASQVRKPLYRSSVGRWAAYKDFLQPLLDELRSE